MYICSYCEVAEGQMVVVFQIKGLKETPSLLSPSKAAYIQPLLPRIGESFLLGGGIMLVLMRSCECKTVETESSFNKKHKHVTLNLFDVYC